MEEETVESQKTKIAAIIGGLRNELTGMSDFIFDHPEIGYQEVQSARLLTDYLSTNGFEIEHGYGGLSTAFRAIYRNGKGGPCIGLLCEYDAVLNLGHACGHHLQGPSVIGAAIAIKNTVTESPFVLEVIGTPAEEMAEGGKNIMLEHGAFKNLDVALMMHAGDATQVDVRSRALSEYVVTFNGITAHAAIATDKGRSALEAVLLVFQGIAFLRGHVREEVRIHGIIENGGQSVNAIPQKAVARIEMRAYDRSYLNQVISRVMKILDGAAQMTETNFDLRKITDMHNKIPVHSLNRLLMRNAQQAKAPAITPPREQTGSTDFASVMYYVPGSCIRVPFIEKGVTAHSQACKGKSHEAHEALSTGARILAMTVLELIEDKTVLAEVIEEFLREKAKIIQ